MSSAQFQIPLNINFASIVFTGFRIPGRRFPSNGRNFSIQFDRNSWISFNSPFTIDQEWRKWLGEVISDRIEHGRGTLVLTSLEESSSDTEVLLNKRLELILWGICIVIGIPEFELGDKVYGRLQQDTSVQPNIKIAPGIPHLYQTVQEISTLGARPIPPEITIDELNQAVRFATCMETIDNAIEHERRTSGISESRSITHLYTRPMGGFMAFRLGVPLSFAPERLHQFARTIEACLPATVRGRDDFASYLIKLLPIHPDNERTLKEIYDLRSAQEHIRPFDRRALPNEPDPDLVARRRTRQSEALAREMLKRFFSGPSFLSHFRDESTLGAFWTSGDAIQAWGTPLFDLQSIL